VLFTFLLNVNVSFVVLGFVSSIPSQEIGLGNMSKMTYFV